MGRQRIPYGTADRTKGGYRKFPSGGPLKRHVTAPARGAHAPVPGFSREALDGTTRFPSRRFAADAVPRLLISGMNSRKIGKRVTKGKWKGMPIYTLTLVERETCPRSCKAWLTCYGNNMHYSRRIIAGAELERRLREELWVAAARHPEGFVVRLHVLGDFYSLDYVRLWEQAINDLPALRVFGYTARHHEDDPIGRELYRIARDRWDRFAMRFSGQGLDRLGAEIIEPGASSPHVICPAQRARPSGKPMADCCAACAFCWHGTKTVAFYEH